MALSESFIAWKVQLSTIPRFLFTPKELLYGVVSPEICSSSSDWILNKIVAAVFAPHSCSQPAVSEPWSCCPGNMLACLAIHFLPSLGLCNSGGGHQCICSAVLQLLVPGPWLLAPLLLLGPWKDTRQIYTNHPAPGFLTVTLSQTLPSFLWPLNKEQPTSHLTSIPWLVKSIYHVTVRPQKEGGWEPSSPNSLFLPEHPGRLKRLFFRAVFVTRSQPSNS